MTYREICLNEAKRVVCQSREQEYGSPEDSFQQIRELWEAYLGFPLGSYDVAMMMALLKIARIKSGHFKEDSFVDAAGYIACGYEIARWVELKDKARRESERNFAKANRDKAASEEETREETGKREDSEARGENATRGDSETQSENDTPTDTDTPPDTDPQTQTNTQSLFQFSVRDGETKTDTAPQSQFQFGVRDGETKTAEEREKEIEQCVAYGLRESQRAYSPVLRDAQRGVGPGFCPVCL